LKTQASRLLIFGPNSPKTGFRRPKTGFRSQDRSAFRHPTFIRNQPDEDMMTRLIPLFTALLISTAAYAEPPGLTQRALPVAHTPGAIEAAIWYPAAAGGAPITYAKNPVFIGVEAREGAPPLAGKRPLVLLSHGLGGNNRSMAWLAAGLAEQGAIVVAVNHPGSTTSDFDIDRGLDHWTRVADLRSATDALLADPVFGPLIDQTRIAAAGFSYGGWTALSIGGLRSNLAGYAAHCDAVGDRSTHCRDLAEAGVTLASRDAEKWNADYRDPRVAKVIGIDAALTWGLTAQDAAGLQTDTLLIGLGSGDDRLFATDTRVQGSGFVTLAPQAEVAQIAPGAHFTALLTCTENGAAILAEEQDYPICTDPAGTNRDAVHAQIIAKIAAFLAL
jgi:predicted dienelactone hydrolase